MGNVSYALAFVGGLLSFLSPCVLPLVPGYVALISGASLEELKEGANQKVQARAFLHSILFIAGFSLVFIVLGASASWAGQVLLAKRTLLTRIAGLLIILFGLNMIGVLKIGMLYRDTRVTETAKPASMFGSFLVGLAFAFGWSPCLGPVLAGILGIAATSDRVGEGMLLLSVYALGLALPFLLTTLGLSQFLRFYQRFRKHLHTMEVCSGVLLIVLGVLLASNQFTRLSGYLSFLNRFSM
jgi:cytochrome c-type biogenesis protein